MSDSILTQRKVLAFRVQASDGVYLSPENILYAKTIIYDPTIEYPVEFTERNPAREFKDSLAQVQGAGMVRIKFRTDLKGSGTAGTAPSIGPLLRACGMGETIRTGVASNTVPAKHPKRSNSTVTIGPTISGTYTGTKNGTFFLTLESLVADTSATFRWQFFPDDGTAFSTGTVAMTGVGPTVMTLGLSLNLALNPDTSTTGWIIGDQWTFTATSDQSVEASYKNISASEPSLSFAYYRDGQIHRAHTCRGTFEMVGNRGKPPFIDWDFMGSRETGTGITDGALLTGIAYENVQPIAFQGIATDILGVAIPCYTNFELDKGNKLEMLECAQEVSGYEGVRLVGPHMAKGKFDPIAQLLATFNPWDEFFSSTPGTGIDVTIGSTSGNIVQILSQYAQIVNIAPGSRTGHEVDLIDVTFPAPEFDAGGDYSPIELIFK